MGAKSGTCCRRIRLNGVALVKQVLVVELLQKPPQSLDVAVVVSDVRIFKVNPVANAFGKVGPVTCIFHHFATAGVVVVLYRNLLADVLFCDAESLFHTKFHWQTVGIPASLAVNLVTCQSLVAADNVLDCTCHNVMDTRHSVCRWRAFEEDERLATFAGFYTFVKGILLCPEVFHFVVNLKQIELLILGKLLCHCTIFKWCKNTIYLRFTNEDLRFI